MASFGDVLKKVRKGKGKSQSGIAEIAGVSLRTILHWEKNEKEPGWYKVQNIAHRLDVDITRFFSDETAMEYAIRKEATKLLLKDKGAKYGRDRKELLEGIAGHLARLDEDSLKIVEQLISKMGGSEK